MSSRQEQIESILDHYENPRHRGPLADPDAVATGRNPGCGDVVTLFLKFDGGERIVAVSFEGEGCTISQAGASMLTEMALGKTLAEAGDMDARNFEVEMGGEVVASRWKCAALALNTLKSAGASYRAGRAARSAAEAIVENY